MKTKTKTKQRTKAPKTPEFPIPRHATLTDSLPAEETVSFDHLNTEAEILEEVGKYSDQFRALVAQMERTRRLGMDLYRYGQKKFGPNFGQPHFAQVSIPSERIDGRKIHNPEKNLKISVRRVFDWAKKQGKTADEAREHCFHQIEDLGRTRFGMAKIPESVIAKIEQVHKFYDRIGTDQPIPADA